MFSPNPVGQDVPLTKRKGRTKELTVGPGGRDRCHPCSRLVRSLDYPGEVSGVGIARLKQRIDDSDDVDVAGPMESIAGR